MMNILETIVAKKKIEVAERKVERSISVLEKLPFFQSQRFHSGNFYCVLIRRGLSLNLKNNHPQKELSIIVRLLLT